MMKRYRQIDQKILFGLVELDPERDDAEGQKRSITKLSPGMVLGDDSIPKLAR